MNYSIKRGVSLYSYQEEYFLRKMSLEGCIAAVAETGATGIEILGEQMVPGFPKLTDEFVDQWFGWMGKYGVTPVCHDMFLDFKRFKDRRLTEDEQLESIIKDLKFANRLGFKVMRIIVSTTPELMERAAPYAEEYDVRMGIEIHSPWHINSAWMTRHWEVMEKTGSKYLGFVPDMGMFLKKLPRVQIENMIRKGADEKIAEFVCEQHERGVMAEYIIAEVYQMSDRPIDRAVAEMSRHNIYNNPNSLIPFKNNILHIHAKFYEMLDDYTEYSIPYPEVIEVLKKCEFDGYLSSEYEGNRHIQDIMEVDSVEQVRRQQEMFKRLLD
ncbi:MAG: TIM barrel protein [Ignavibacteria bacterium]|jgi:sugar phosphate isomerase/epimerase